MVIGFIGTTELLLIGGLALLLVGGKKLPEMMRGLGKGVREFKDGMKEVSASHDEEERYNRDENEEMSQNSVGMKAMEIDKTSKNS